MGEKERAAELLRLASESASEIGATMLLADAETALSELESGWGRTIASRNEAFISPLQSSGLQPAQEVRMPVETPSIFSKIIEEHLELKRRNAELERDLPISRYVNEDPFQNHPLFKTEEQARLEETMDGTEPAVDAIVAEAVAPEVALQAWTEESSVAVQQPVPHVEDEDGLWSRSRDFDWGD